MLIGKYDNPMTKSMISGSTLLQSWGKGGKNDVLIETREASEVIDIRTLPISVAMSKLSLFCLGKEEEKGNYLSWRNRRERDFKLQFY